MNDPELNNPAKRRNFILYGGGLCALFLLLQIITGALLSIYYEPSAEDAYNSIQYINNQVEFGSFIRSIHYWSAHALILSAGAFIISVFFARAYRAPNRRLWYILLLSFIILLSFAFTGQSLPWTEFSYFGAVIGISQVDKIPVAGHLIAELIKGGSYFGGETLSRIFSIHTILLPALLFLILAACFYFIRTVRASNFKSEINTGSKTDSLSSLIPIAALTGLAIITIISVLIPKGLGKPYDIANPSGAPEGIHPEWYFMWIYQTLKADNFLPGIITQLFILVFALFWFTIPALEDKFSNSRNNSAIKFIGYFSVLYVLIMTVWGYIVSGISPPEISSPGNIATGGIDRYSFLGIILFTIAVMIGLLYLRNRPKT